jgi:hypothetical protein
MLRVSYTCAVESTHADVIARCAFNLQLKHFNGIILLVLVVVDATVTDQALFC